MFALVGGATQLGWVALKALLLFVTAVVGFRLGERRTLAEMSAFDFAAAVAVGAIIGRVPNSSTTSYVAGAVTLVTVLAAHRVIACLRHLPPLARWVDHPPRVLVAEGQVLAGELRKSGLTRQDLHGLLRQHGVGDLAEVWFVVFEQRGQVSVIRRQGGDRANGLVREIAPEA